MSKVLFDADETMVFNPRLAVSVGLTNAIVLQQIHYWIKNKNCNGVSHSGMKWIYNTIPQWAAQFPFFSSSTIKRSMLELRDKNLIFVEKLSGDGRNHTNYYSINYTELSSVYAKSIGSNCTEVQNEPMHEVKMSQCIGSNWDNPNRTETTTETTVKVTKADYSALFDKFWKTYPKRVGKDAALKAFAKRKPDDKMLGEMLAAIDKQKSTDMWAKDNGQYIPNPATWLNQGRWMDEVDGGSSGGSAFMGGI